MRNKLGTICMVLGAVLILGALSLFLYNQREAAAAEQASADVLPQLLEQIQQRQEEQAATPNYSSILPPGTPLDFTDPSAFEMTEVEIDGYAYIGYLSIPTLNLELPVMAEWDYARLTIAPCRYTGSTKRNDLVLLAHNYTQHFGTLLKLSPGDAVYFTDMDGITSSYEVDVVEILQPTAVEEMTSGEYDLTLFTCTLGGKSRVTVRCVRIEA